MHEHSSHNGTHLNAQFTDNRIEILNQDQFLLPSESCLYIVSVGLINNAVMYLFDRVSYKLSEREVEGYYYPGVAPATYKVEVNLYGGLIKVNQ